MPVPSNANFNTENAKRAKRPVYLFEIAGYTRKFISHDMSQPNQYPWTVEVEPLRQSASDLRGTSELSDLTVRVIDKDNLVTADFPSLVFEGRVATLKIGFDAIAQGDFITRFTGEVDRVESADRNTVWSFVCKPKLRGTKEVIFTTGDDGKPTSADHPRTVEGNPIEIIREVWLTELGLSAGEIDGIVLDAYENQLFSAFKLRFALTSAPEAKAFLDKEIFQPLGGYAFARADGKLSVKFFWPTAGSVVSQLTLTDQNLITLPTLEQSDLINVVTHRFDYDGSELRSENVEIFTASETKYGQQGRHVVDSRGMRSNLQGFSLARLVARSVFNRYGDKNARVDVELFWDACLLEIGDFVRLTHPLVPDRETGTVGVTAHLFEVLNGTLNFRKGTVRLSLVDASDVELASASFFKWAPDGTPDFAAASQAQRDAYMFVADDATGDYSTGADGHRLA